MKIEELQLHLTNLANLFRAAKAKTPAEELEDLAEFLQPYRDKKLADFIGLLAKAEAEKRAALDRVAAMEAALAAAKVKPPPKGRQPKKDAGTLNRLFTRLVDLYSRAAQPSVTRNEMLEALDELDRLGPSEKELKRLAPQLNIPANFKKDELLRQIREALLTRKGMAERVNV